MLQIIWQNKGLPLTTIAAYGLLSYITYHVILALYRAYLHPLSKFPGPKFAAATRIPYLYMKWTGTQPYAFAKYHERYGPVVRVSPTELSFNTAQAWKDIYGHRSAGKHSFVKDPDFYGPSISGETHIVNTSDEDHSRVKRILSPSFSDRALKEQDPLLRKWANMLVRKLREKCDDKGRTADVDMVSWYNFTTFDVMADLTFAEPLHMLEGSEYCPWVKMTFGSIKIGSRMRVLSQIEIIGTLLSVCIGPIASKMQKQHQAYTDERVDRRMAKDPERPDLWSHIMRRKDLTEGGLTRKEMYSNASIFMIAGTETTATWLSGTTFLLLKNPDKMEILLEEIRGLETVDRLTLEELAKLKYLNAVLEEGLRCYPPVPCGLPRVVPQEGASINGEWIPGGIVVSVDQWSGQKTADHFHLPEKFIPERWLQDAPAEFANDDKAAMNPFSFGPRNCLGKNLAYHEARLLLASVLYHFDMELVHKEKDWMDQRVFFLWDKPELMVRLNPI